jgi:hypothetical protein
MKSFIETFLFVFIISLFFSEFVFSQTCDSCGCGTRPGINETDNPGTFFGARYKPNRTDIGGNDSNYFPILIVFVQFKNELGDSTTTNFESWPARRPPNYIDSVIRFQKNSLVNWWDSYNGYAISDYWHEFSRGKLHIRGRAYSIILPHDTAWYDSTGRGHAKLNKDIYDALIALNINWSFYDKWTYNYEGNFSYSPDQRLDMLYIVYRSWPLFAFQNGQYSSSPLSLPLEQTSSLD